MINEKAAGRSKRANVARVAAGKPEQTERNKQRWPWKLTEGCSGCVAGHPTEMSQDARCTRKISHNSAGEELCRGPGEGLSKNMKIRSKLGKGVSK